MQEHAEQLKERFRPEIDLYYDVMEAAKKAAVAKKYWFGQKQFVNMGK